MPDEKLPQTLLTALLEVQKALPALKLSKDATNPAYRSKYLTLDKLHDAVLPLLNKHGLVWLTRPELGGNDEPVLNYSLHLAADRDDSIFGTMPLVLDKSNMQALGSAITYARRYSLLSVLGAVADEDDDGAKASESRPSRPPEPVTQAKKPEDRLMTAEELATLEEACREAGKDIRMAAKAVGKDVPQTLTVANGWAILEKLKAKGPVAA
jgi:hypothetical protein